MLFDIPSVGNRFSFLNSLPVLVNVQKLNARTLRTTALELKSISISDLIASVCLQSQAGIPNGSLNMFCKPEEGTNCRVLASSIARLLKINIRLIASVSHLFQSSSYHESYKGYIAL